MKYKHYPFKQADAEGRAGMRKKYRVTTINWTYATIRGEVHKDQVHKNEYVWTLRHLIQWIQNSIDVAEDVIDIQPI